MLKEVIIPSITESSTFAILNVYWNTIIAVVTFVSSFLLSFLISMSSFILKCFYEKKNKNSPILRPFIIVMSIFLAVVTGWIIENFGLKNETLTYFTLAISSLIGRITFESVLHNQFLFKGIFYIAGMNILGIILGTFLSVILIHFYSKTREEYNIKKTFGYEPLPFKVFIVKELIVWFIVSAIIPFAGYLIFLKNTFFNPLTIVLMTLAIIFICLVLTQKFGYYNGNIIYSFCLQFINCKIINNPYKKRILHNMPVSVVASFLFPMLWGFVYSLILIR